MRIAAAVALALAGCLFSATPYQPEKWDGGYRDKPLGPGVYFIEVHVNSYTSRSTAMEYLHRRAGELCPAGYDILDKDASTGYAHYQGRAYAKPETSAVIQCRPEEQSPESVPGWGRP